MENHMINIENLTKFYGDQKGIENVTFSVNKGDIFGFIGPNGAGKTTTIRTLLSLIKPTSGHAEIFGMDCIKHSRAIAARVGYLPAETYYYDKMRVKELLKYAAELYKVDAKARIVELSERLKLDVNRKIVELSSGNKKKVAIVAALLHSPELLIMDEPTSGLDPLIQRTFFEILKEENKKGVTILFSSHVLSDVQKISNKVAILKDGTVINIHNASEMREFGYKKINLSAYKDIPENYFSTQGIADYKQNEKEASFIYKGEISAIIGKINDLKVRDVDIQEPSLEEIFLHYYK